MTLPKNPVLNTPYDPPTRHHELDVRGQPTGKIADARRSHRHVVPVARARRQGGDQGELSLEYEDRSDNSLVKSIRPQVDAWRMLPTAKWGVTAETERLITFWRDRGERRLPFFFCQLEAIETLIWLAEVAGPEFRKSLEGANDQSNPGLFRIAAKMATGSGKTTVMAMLIVWSAINAARKPNSTRFTNGFLIVAPGITIRDRLRVLKPEELGNYYEDSDRRIVPPDLLDDLRKARVVIANYHQFQLRETVHLSKTSRQLLGERGEPKYFTETEGQMIRRVAADLMGHKRILVLNDEAHHCYRAKAGESEESSLTAEEREEAKSNSEAARVWISGIEAFQRQFEMPAVYDLSATPFFLRGSGYGEGTLFPWVVSDFSLMDAIECGIVKTPRLPVLDNTVEANIPKYRQLYQNLPPNSLPRAGRSKQSEPLDPEQLPELLRGGVEALYAHYEKVARTWLDAGIDSPPVFIVVANNTATSKLIYDFIAGYETVDEKGIHHVVQGKLSLFSNVDSYSQWRQRPHTILVDSEALERDELRPEFLEAAAKEIEDFRKEVARRLGAAEAEKLSDAQILREVMNTVGKPGKLGAGVRCVVSVSMLTEGWDVNTVTHVLGVRAFGTQLLCEQVVGRALRRVSYEPGSDGRLDPEYADVLGVPFDFAQSASDPVVRPPPKLTRVTALEERAQAEIRFPRIDGYGLAFPAGRLAANFTDDSKVILRPDDVPTETLVEPIVGEGITLTLDNYEHQRPKAVWYNVASYTLRRYFRDDTGAVDLSRFSDLLRITEQWFSSCLSCRGKTSQQMFLWGPLAQRAAEKIFRACVPQDIGSEFIRALVNPYNEWGSTKFVNFTTSKTTLYPTDPILSHVSHVVYDSDWEAAFVTAIERELRDTVLGYVKNHNLDFEVPYEYRGERRRYRPDYILKVDDGCGKNDPLHLIAEIKGARTEQDASKADTMRNRWIPGVNAAAKFGRWDFLELRDPYTLARDVAAFVTARAKKQAA